MQPEPKRVVAYTRVSTDEQAAKGDSLEAQEERIAAYCRMEGLCVMEWFCDPGISGGDPGRPGLKRALETLDRGEADGIVVAKLDRLTRNLRHWLDLVDQRFGRADGHRLYLVRDAVDLTTAMGWFLSVIRVAISQLEILVGAERTADVMGPKRAKGHRLGTIPYGRELDPAGPRNADGNLVGLRDSPVELAVLESMRAGRAKGWSYRQIATQLNDGNVPARSGGVWRASTVQQILSRAEFRPGAHHATEEQSTSALSEPNLAG